MLRLPITNFKPDGWSQIVDEHRVIIAGKAPLLDRDIMTFVYIHDPFMSADDIISTELSKQSEAYLGNVELWEHNNTKELAFCKVYVERPYM